MEPIYYWGIGYLALSFFTSWRIYVDNQKPPVNQQIPLFVGFLPIINILFFITDIHTGITSYFRNRQVSLRQQRKFVEYYRSIKNSFPASECSKVNEIRESILKHGYITKSLYNKYRPEIEKVEPGINKGQILLDMMDEKEIPGLDKPANVVYNTETNEELKGLAFEKDIA